MRQSQQHIARLARTGLMGSFEDRLHLGVGERGDDRRDHYTHRHARFGETADSHQAARRLRRTRLECACERGVECRDRNVHLGQAL